MELGNGGDKSIDVVVSGAYGADRAYGSTLLAAYCGRVRSEPKS